MIEVTNFLHPSLGSPLDKMKEANGTEQTHTS